MEPDFSSYQCGLSKDFECQNSIIGLSSNVKKLDF